MNGSIRSRPRLSIPTGPGGKQMTRFLLDETGLELSEYAVAAALVAIAVATAFTTLGDAIGVRLNELVSRVNG